MEKYIFSELDVVSLAHNIPEYNLSEGSKGAIVEVYGKDSFAVEFVDEEGYTIALLDLSEKDVRLVWSKNMHTEIPYATMSMSESKDTEIHWTFPKISKPDPASVFTGRFAF